MNGERPWSLVAPWYRWPSQGVPARETRPVFQKYDTSQLVREFLADPQRSLRFVGDDRHAYVDRLPALAPPPPPFTVQRRRLVETTLVRTNIRKLFLDSHKRFYLIVCELHRDGPGFSCVSRDEACEAGFVIRRRRLAFPKDRVKEAAKLTHAISRAAVQLAELERLLAVDLLDEDGTPLPVDVAERLKATVADWRETASDELLAERLQLLDWARQAGATRTLEGWFPSTHEKIGSWGAVGESPADVAEAVLPLYPLVPDPRQADHAGSGSTIYFGIVPTASADAEPNGVSRFDDESLYEIRCFVRRHDPHCPKSSERRDCHGPIVWSRPTETYRLAPHFDPIGTANHPVTIQLPDIPALAAAPAKAPVRMVAPPGSSFVFEQNNQIPTKGSLDAGGQICSFSIPLITIVAMFVFNLFLPIVVLVFQLWFLLKLKFCIPPSIDVAGRVNAELAMVPPSVDLSLDIDAQMSVAGRVALGAKLQADFGAELGVGMGKALVIDDPLRPGYTNDPLIRFHQDLAIDHEAADNAPSFTANLEYEAEVSPAEVSLR